MKNIKILSLFIGLVGIVSACGSDDEGTPELGVATYNVTVTGGPLDGRNFSGTADDEDYINLSYTEQSLNLSGVTASFTDNTSETTLLLNLVFPTNSGSSFSGVLLDGESDDADDFSFLFIGLDSGEELISYYSKNAGFQVSNYKMTTVGASQGNQIGSSTFELKFDGLFYDGQTEAEVQIRGTLKFASNLN
ncbi:MAG: hypothetical protein ACFCUU_00065 [Cyclobacteriaceae bacterium]